MYIYDEYDQQIVDQRVAQYRNQTERFLAGELSEDEYRPLRLQNGLYIQRHAPMLRIAIPYGLLSSVQLRKLAYLTRNYDKGYGHFTTRQNLQLNWPKLEEVPDILEHLASVQMHAIQTSGNCIRNITADPYAGVAKDEIEDSRPYCEIIRQWSTFHPEFAYLPRKFKIAVSGSQYDRAATQVHDIGVHLVKNADQEVGFRILAGGGLGRTPVIGKVIKEFLPKQHLLTFLDAILRVYNLHGRRDNKYKSRIKILVRAMGAEAFAAKVDAEWQHLKDGPATLTQEEIDRVKCFFKKPQYQQLSDENPELQKHREQNTHFKHWLNRNVHDHQIPGYAIVTFSLKQTGVPPGDLSDTQMEAVAELAERFSCGEIRVTHQQNLVLAHVKKSALPALWQQAQQHYLVTANLGLLTDIICCPGGDFCALANAKSIPIAEAIQRRFDNLDYLYDLGDLELNISGCMNACGHHHVGHIGILGVDKKGSEYYQISIGGNQGNKAAIGKIIGPSFAQEEVTNVIEKIINTYVQKRTEEECFIDTYGRIGIEPFKEAVYATNH